MVHSPVKPFLAIEWLQPGEGEDIAALRLLRRLRDPLSDPTVGYRWLAVHSRQPATGAVRSEEVLERNRYRQGKLTAHSTDHEWLWITTLAPAFAAATLRQLGHSRWKNENNGWMDLTKYWVFKHGFLHACRHRPKQINTSEQRELVPWL